MAEENKDGLIADVPNTEPVEPNPEETTIPHKEEEQTNTAPQEEKTEEVKLEKPDYIEDKFWDEKEGVKTEDLSKSYTELQKQFSMGKHKAPKEYDMAALEDIDEDDELASYFKDWAKENKPTQAAFDNLVNKFKELSELKFEEYKKIIENSKKEVIKIHLESKHKLDKDIQTKKDMIEKEIETEITKAQKEIAELKKNSISDIQNISKDLASNIIENISGDKLNESSIKAAVENVSKNYTGKYL